MRNIILVLLAAVMMVSCGASGKVAKKPVKTYVQPGSELLNAPNVLRAWAVGISDSEMTAKKKAWASASSELARMLNSAVTTTVEEYCVKLSDGDVTAFKEFFSQKCDIVSKQLLVGVRQVFDQWEPKDAEGMHKNYIVLELSAEEFIDKLLESINQSQGAGNFNIDKQLLNEIFFKKINSGK